MEDNNSLETENTEGAESTSSLETTATDAGGAVDNTGKIVDKTPEKAKLPFFKRLLRKMNVYLLLQLKNLLTYNLKKYYRKQG